MAQKNMIDGEIPVQVFLPPSGTGPGLVLVQEIFGVSAYIQARAADLAALGYAVAVPQLYWRIGVDATPEEGDDMLAQAMAASAALPWEDAVADTARTVTWVRKRSDVVGGVGLIGFCYGGGVAFAAAAQVTPDVLISYYGSALPRLLDLAPQVQIPSLHHWGDQDAFIPLEAQREVKAAVVHDSSQEWFTHPGAGHAFDNPNPAFHHAQASATAWDQTRDFLQRRLPVS